MKYALVLLSMAAAVRAAALPGERSLAAGAHVDAIFFSADSGTLVASCSDRHVRSWNVSSGKVIADRSMSGRLIGPGLLAEQSADRKSFQILDVAANQRLFSLEKPVRNASLSPDGKRLAVSSERSLLLLDAATGAPGQTLPAGLGGAAAIAFSPDGRAVVSADLDNDVRIWRTESGELVRKFEEFTGAMFAAAFTHDGRHLVMGGLDETLYIFDAADFTLQRKLTGHGETILSLAISPNDRTAVTGGFDVLSMKNPAKLVFWDLTTGVVTRTLRAPHAITNLVFAPNGNWLAMTVEKGNEISLFNLATPSIADVAPANGR